MVVRAAHEAVESISRLNRPISLDLDRLAGVIRDANRPVAIQDLAREAVRAMIVADGPLRTYVPGRTYEQGERLRLLDGRLGDIVSLEYGDNATQGLFDIIVVRLREGETVRLAANVAGAPQAASPELVTDEIVDMLLLPEGREQEIVRNVRQALATDPRFITLYYRDGEYGCLREFFPPMSPDVLDAALALLLDELFEQIPISRLTDTSDIEAGTGEASQASVESLFSAARLEDALSREGDSQDPARSVFETVRSLWQRAEVYGHAWDEAQFASGFLQPLLRALGWSSVPLPEQGGIRRSAGDGHHAYALCADEFAASELYIRYDDDAAVDRWASALAEVAAWGQQLDQPGARQPASPMPEDGEEAGSGEVTPAHRLVGGLRQTGIRWGMVTNGRIWRLVSRDANSLARAYYQVDLGEVFADLASGEMPDREQWQAFRRWWLLFRQASYVQDHDGRCLLEHLREREPRAERRMRALLRERLLTRALPAVAGGFVAYRRQRLGVSAETPAMLQAIHRASVLFLTRLLFILVAEARDLLPLSDPNYRPHSLTTQAEWAVERVRRNLPLSSGVYTTARYDVVLTLLQRVAKGDPEKSLPTYGRLLYNPSEREDHRFLGKARLSDAAFAHALDAIFRGIDYAALDARDLIGVCSALLGSEVSVIDADAGHVLITRQGDERVRSDTYPDFVVTSVVEQALDPVLRARSALFAEAMNDVVAVRRRLRRTLDRRKRSVLHAEWESAARRARDAFLGMRICDPAMGAGEFLLSAVDVVTDGIIDCLQAYHRDHPDVPRAWNPIYRLLDEVSQDVGEEMARQGVAFESQTVSDTLVLSRLVAQRTMFGVADD
ncbi:MAG: hypothetical protein JXC32_13580, partial [Anaerolineae bacterium]|nr:hypothetical protein [Anaerolineae bacterium]